MKKQVKYQIILNLAMLLILSILVFKPVYHLVSHLNDDEDIELCEDSNEQEQEEDCCEDEIELFFNQPSVSVFNICQKQKNIIKHFSKSYISVYTDVLIPPPKLG